MTNPIVPIEEILSPAVLRERSAVHLEMARQRDFAPLVELRRQSDRRSAEMSLERQGLVNNRAAERLGRGIIATFVEPNVSGRGLLHERPVLLEAMAFVKDCLERDVPVGGFIVEAVHRVARRGSVAHALWEFAEDHRLGIWMASYPAALTRAQFTLEAGRGTDTWQEDQTKLHLGRRLGALSGRMMGPVKWGYEVRHDLRSEQTGRVERGRWQKDDIESEDVKYAFRLFVDDDMEVNELISAMDRLKLSRPKGCVRWTPQRLIGYPGQNRYGIFGDPIYTGWSIYDLNPKETVTLGDDMDRSPIIAPMPELVIIDDIELWKAAKAKVIRLHAEILERRAENRRAFERRPSLIKEPEQQVEVLLKDKVCCAVCAEPLHVVASKPRRTKVGNDEVVLRERWWGHAGKGSESCPGCRTLSIEAVDAAVLLLTDLALQPKNRAEIFLRAVDSELMRQRSRLETDKRRLARGIDEVERLIERAEIGALMSASTALSSAANKRYSVLKDKLRSLRNKAKALEKVVMPTIPEKNDLEVVSNSLEEIRRKLPFEASTEKRIGFRSSLSQLIHKARVRRLKSRTFGLVLEGPITALLCDDPDVTGPGEIEWEFRLANRREGLDLCDRVVFMV